MYGLFCTVQAAPISVSDANALAGEVRLLLGAQHLASETDTLDFLDEL